MKKEAYLFLAAAAVCSVAAQTTVSREPEWKPTIKVIGEAGEPVAGANAKVSWYVNRPDHSTTFDKIEGLTDANGVFKTSHEANGSISLGFTASKAGYYPATEGHEFARFKQTDPARWNPSVTLLLKRVVKPIAMYAKRVMQMPPEKEKGVGYDLQVGDWVAPHGKGLSTDIIFTSHFDKRAQNDWDYSLTVSFPNVGDGIRAFTISDIEKTSLLRSPQEAPESGYESRWIKTQSQRPGEHSQYGINDNLNFFFRVRTVLDEGGHVKSANYGKIYGDFMNFRYFLNPTPNSRSLEPDPAKNLMKNLGPSEGVGVQR